MLNIINLVPAYGRDYKSKKALLIDWDSGRDFLIYSTTSYVNQSQLKAMARNGITEVRFRYLRLTKLHIIEIGVDDE